MTVRLFCVALLWVFMVIAIQPLSFAVGDAGACRCCAGRAQRHARADQDPRQGARRKPAGRVP